MNNKILVTGGDGRFAKVLKTENKKLKLIFVSKNQCNILKENSIIKCFKKYKPKIVIHTAGLSRPMRIHDHNISKSIELNIIGTLNICNVINNNFSLNVMKKKVKLIKKKILNERNSSRY